MDNYLNFINSNILTLLLSKIEFHEFNALQSIVDLNGINYLYLVTVRFKNYMKEITKEFRVVGLREYKLILCSLKVKIQLKLEKLKLEEICSAKEINAFGKEIEEIPKEIGNLINLRNLSLGNRIEKIPKEIGNLTNLRKLYLSNNQIKGIPKEIGNLISLQELHLDRNQIKEIPREIGKLVGLRQLYLDDNPIREIPKEIRNLKNLVIFK